MECFWKACGRLCKASYSKTNRKTKKSFLLKIIVPPRDQAFISYTSRANIAPGEILPYHNSVNRSKKSIYIYVYVSIMYPSLYFLSYLWCCKSEISQFKASKIPNSALWSSDPCDQCSSIKREWSAWSENLFQMISWDVRIVSGCSLIIVSLWTPEKLSTLLSV